jgi:hypothetical protein
MLKTPHNFSYHNYIITHITKNLEIRKNKIYQRPILVFYLTSSPYRKVGLGLDKKYAQASGEALITFEEGVLLLWFDNRQQLIIVYFCNLFNFYNLHIY